MGVLEAVIGLAMILGHVATFSWQSRRISSLKDELKESKESLRVQLSISETNSKIFDPEKLAKHVENMEKGARRDALNALYELPEIKQVMNEALQNNLTAVQDKYERIIGGEYQELFDFACGMIALNREHKGNLNVLMGRLPTVGDKILEAVFGTHQPRA